MIRLYGAYAVRHATLSATTARDKGDAAAFHRWTRVTDAIRDLERAPH